MVDGSSGVTQAKRRSARGPVRRHRSGVRDATICERVNRAAQTIFRRANIPQERKSTMLKLALFFLVVSLIAALFGFGGISAAAADIARILFFIAIVIFLVLLVAGLMAGSTLF
jgi:uncharacterized membrane protein YtjA (UPF0391 family)